MTIAKGTTPTCKQWVKSEWWALDFICHYSDHSCTVQEIPIQYCDKCLASPAPWAALGDFLAKTMSSVLCRTTVTLLWSPKTSALWIYIHRHCHASVTRHRGLTWTYNIPERNFSPVTSYVVKPVPLFKQLLPLLKVVLEDYQ